MDLKEKEGTINEIKFNVLIPLFNVYDWEQNTQDTRYYDPESASISGNLDSSGQLIINSGDTKNHFDIPLGIWISEKPVILERTGDASKKYRPSWSLCISSQFKPFPYSNVQSGLRDSDNLDIYGTFE